VNPVFCPERWLALASLLARAYAVTGDAVASVLTPVLAFQTDAAAGPLVGLAEGCGWALAGAGGSAGGAEGDAEVEDAPRCPHSGKVAVGAGGVTLTLAADAHSARASLLAAPISALPAALGAECAVVWAAVLLRRRVGVISARRAAAEAFVRAAPAAVWHRQDWGCIVPWAKTKAAVRAVVEMGVFVAAFDRVAWLDVFFFFFFFFFFFLPCRIHLSLSLTHTPTPTHTHTLWRSTRRPIATRSTMSPQDCDVPADKLATLCDVLIDLDSGSVTVSPKAQAVFKLGRVGRQVAETMAARGIAEKELIRGLAGVTAEVVERAKAGGVSGGIERFMEAVALAEG
jgi:hypothetical protein